MPRSNTQNPDQEALPKSPQGGVQTVYLNMQVLVRILEYLFIRVSGRRWSRRSRLVARGVSQYQPSRATISYEYFQARL